MAITLKDLAKLAGVAESTVSRALNDKAGVGADTKAKIQELAEKYNYRPNRLAQGLANNKTKVIALLVPDLDTQSNFTIIKKVEEAAEVRGYQVIICNTDRQLDKTDSYLQLLASQQIDGAIIVGEVPTGGSLIRLGLDHGRKLVLINKLLEELRLTSHLIDYQKAGYIAVEELQRNSGDLVIILGDEKDYIEQEKLAGFAQACRDYDCNFGVINGVKSREEGYNAFFKLVELVSPPVGLYLTSNLSALGIMEAIKTGGWLIPSDFQIVGSANTMIASLTNPALTVIDEPLETMAAAATEDLITCIETESREDTIEVYQPGLTRQESTRI